MNLSHTFIRSLSAAVLFASLIPAGIFARGIHQTKPYIVVLDPGHGGAMHYGNEFGAMSADGKLIEKNMTLKVAKRTAKDLRAMGYKVYLTRARDQAVNTPPRDWNGDGKIDSADESNARTIFANAHHADLFVSIHFDGSSDSSVRGTHGFYCPSRPFWRDNQRLADLLTGSVVNSMQQGGYADVNGGVETDVADIVPQMWPDYPWFLVLGPSRHHRVVATRMPGALVETLFMTNQQDDAAMRRSVVIAAIARGYATGIREYFHGHVDH